VGVSSSHGVVWAGREVFRRGHAPDGRVRLTPHYPSRARQMGAHSRSVPLQYRSFAARHTSIFPLQRP